ncbi:MAG TPA: DnaJ domain-containing protein [Thermoanaerobaculia bacterium]|nr:DnaJ domain-containing protein [Thermoanaerobaculia bacterium]
MEHPEDPQREALFAALTDEELRLFRERVGQGLAERPLALEVGGHQRQAATLLLRVAESNHYELLGLGAGASPAEIHDAYDRTARLVHPAHAGRLGLAGKEGVLEHLFERVTRAYLTLSHPGRRKEYDGQLGGEVWESERAPRDEEGRQVARRYFARAEVLAAQEEFHQAIELLRQAVRTDPRAEYYVLLGQCQARNPHWLRHAIESLEQAVALGDRSPAVAKTLARLRAEREAAKAGPAGERGSRGSR